VQDFAEKLLTTLAEAQCEFVVVGGLSAVLQGVPIVTQDLDVCYRRTPENIRRLALALRPFGLKLRNLPEGLPNIFDEHSIALGSNFTLQLNDGDEFDLLGTMSAIGGYEDIIGNSIEMDIAGFLVRVLSLEDLIRTKRAAGRPKDLAVIPTLEATLQMQRELDQSS